MNSDDSSSEEQERQAIVFDQGSFELRCGFAGNDAPNWEIAPMLARSEFDDDISRSNNSNYIAVGDGAEEEETVEVFSKTRRRGLTSISSDICSILKNPSISTSSPIKHGRVTNWDDMEALWSHCFKKREIGVDPKETPVLSSQKTLLAKDQREKQGEIFFEKFQVPAYYVKEDTVLSTYSSGRTSALAVDSGLNSTTVAPIYEGYLLPHAVKTCHELGGNTVDLFFAKLMMESGRLSIPGGRSELKSSVRVMKESVCRLSENGQTFDFQHLAAEKEKLTHTLPDGAIVEDPDSCFYLAPECLFFPEILLENNNNSFSSSSSTLSSRNKLIDHLKREREDDYAMKHENPVTYSRDSIVRNDTFGSQNATSVHRAALSSIFTCDGDIHRDLFQNIILAGGNTMFANFGDRLKERMNKELGWSEKRARESKNRLSSMNWTVNKVIAPPERKISCWIGGSILASLSTFQTMWVTKEEYDEVGPCIVHNKCY